MVFTSTDLEEGPSGDDAFAGSRRWAPATAVTVLAAALAVHWRALRLPYFFDDWEWLNLSHRSNWLLGEALNPKRDIFRPLLAVLFAGMERGFGLSAIPFHILMLCELVGVALLVVVLARQLAIPRVHASAAGVFYATFGPLALLQIWASTSDIPIAVGCAVGSILLVHDVPTVRRAIAAALLLFVAVSAREFAIVTPVLAVLVLLAQSHGSRVDVRVLARKTGALWLVSLVVGLTRLALGAGANDGPYRIDWFGKHVVTNLVNLVKIAGRFGVPTSGRLLNVVIVVFWITLLSGSIWALRRGDRVPAAGIAWFFVALLPFLPLPNHAMDPYYLALPSVGLALAAASLLRHLPGGLPVVVVVTVAFVVVQAVAVHDYTTHGGFNLAIDRSKAMVRVAERLGENNEEKNGAITVVTHCARDRDLSKDGELFRVMLDRPDLDVNFKVIGPPRC